MTDILDTLIIHELFARERVAFVLIICISTNTCDFRDFLRILYFLIFSCLLLKKNHHTVPICAVDCKILLHYEKKCTTTFRIIKNTQLLAKKTNDYFCNISVLG